MIIQSNELFLIVNTLFDDCICGFSTREEAEKELRILKEDYQDNKLCNFVIRHFKEVE